MFKSKKEKLFDQLLSENERRLYRICYSYLNNKHDIADLYQEILMGIWKSLDHFRQESAWSTYIYRIAVNTAIKFQSKRFNKSEVLGESNINDIPDEGLHSDALKKEAKLNHMHRCIQMLNDTDRLLISLVLEDLSYKEIAGILDSNVNAVGVKINRIKKKLTQLMEVHDGPL